MDCEFSEFSYGFAAIREADALLNTIYSAAGAPRLPSLREEATLGFDARLAFVEYVLLLQFKRPEFVSRFHPSSPTWHRAKGPHYRVAIDTDGRQHDALIRASAGFTAPPNLGDVLYALPAFHFDVDFDRHYQTGNVLENSVFIEPMDFGANRGIHRYVRDEAGASWILSDPEVSFTPQGRSEIQSHVQQRAQTWQDSSRQRATVNDLEGVLESALTELDFEILPDPETPVVNRLDKLAALLGCGLALYVSTPERGSREPFDSNA